MRKEIIAKDCSAELCLLFQTHSQTHRQKHFSQIASDSFPWRKRCEVEQVNLHLLLDQPFQCSVTNSVHHLIDEEVVIDLD